MRALMRSAWSGVRSVARALPGRGGSRSRAAASAARFSAWRAAHGAAPRVPKRRGAGAGACGTGRVFTGGGGRTEGREADAGAACLGSALALLLEFFFPISVTPSPPVSESAVGDLPQAYTTGRVEPKVLIFLAFSRSRSRFAPPLLHEAHKTIARELRSQPRAAESQRKPRAGNAPPCRGGRQRSRKKRDRRRHLDARSHPRGFGSLRLAEPRRRARHCEDARGSRLRHGAHRRRRRHVHGHGYRSRSRSQKARWYRAAFRLAQTRNGQRARVGGRRARRRGARARRRHPTALRASRQPRRALRRSRGHHLAVLRARRGRARARRLFRCEIAARAHDVERDFGRYSGLRHRGRDAHAAEPLALEDDALPHHEPRGRGGSHGRARQRRGPSLCDRGGALRRPDAALRALRDPLLRVRLPDVPVRRGASRSDAAQSHDDFATGVHPSLEGNFGAASTKIRSCSSTFSWTRWPSSSSRPRRSRSVATRAAIARRWSSSSRRRPSSSSTFMRRRVRRETRCDCEFRRFGELRLALARARCGSSRVRRSRSRASSFARP